MNHDEALWTILRRLNAQHDTLEYLCKEMKDMSETLDQAQTNEATALANLTTQVSQIGVAFQANMAEITALLAKVAAGGTPPSAAEISAAQATADGMNAQAAALAALDAPAPTPVATTPAA